MFKKIIFYSTFCLVISGFTPAANAANGEKHCREFTQKIIIDGQEVDGFGKACKSNKDDDWEIVSEAKPHKLKNIKNKPSRVVVVKKRYYPKHKRKNVFGHGYYDEEYDYYDKRRHKRTSLHDEILGRKYFYNKSRYNHHSSFHKKHFRHKHYGHRLGHHGKHKFHKRKYH